MILRLTPAHGRELDLAVAAVRELSLVRRADGCFAQLADAEAGAFRRALAYAGIEAESADLDTASPAGAVPATAADLRPAPTELVISDTVRIRRLSLGAATEVVLGRRFAMFRAPSPAAQLRCRRLLLGEDAMLAWQRCAWIQRGRTRTVRHRSALRPVVFDRAAFGDRDRERRVLASEGALARWAFG